MGRMIRHVTRRLKPSSTFWGGFWQGLAAPTMLYEQPTRRSAYDEANDMIADAWDEVGQQMWKAMGRIDRQVGRNRD